MSDGDTRRNWELSRVQSELGLRRGSRAGRWFDHGFSAGDLGWSGSGLGGGVCGLRKIGLQEIKLGRGFWVG